MFLLAWMLFTRIRAFFFYLPIFPASCLPVWGISAILERGYTVCVVNKQGGINNGYQF